MRTTWITRLLLCFTLCVCRFAHAHPKPGAHADVRFSIERSAVRGEFLMNLRFVEGLINWPRQNRDQVAPDEEPALRAALAEYFGAPLESPISAIVDRPNRVLIDGQLARPIIRECRIIIPPPETRPGFVDVAQAMLPQVLIVAEYPCRTPPRSVALAWGTYPRDFLAQNRDLAPLAPIDAVILAEGDAIPITFTSREPEYTWRASATPLEARFRPVPDLPQAPRRTLPLASIFTVAAGLAVACAFLFRSASFSTRALRATGALLTAAALSAMLSPFGRIAAPTWLTPRPPLPTAADAIAIFAPLHANIYRAFDYTAESDIYDALAQSVDGPLLAKTYDDIYRSLIMHEEGGALSRIRAVTPVSTSVDEIDPEASHLTLTCRWRVDGVVFHWGHSHERTNEYLARYTISSANHAWRITAVTPLEQRRIETSPTPPTSPTSDLPPPP